MNPFFEYLIKSSLSLALFYIVFKLAVSRDKMHTINRFVLLGILFVSAVIPFANFPVFGKTEVITIPKIEEVSEVAETPVFNVEQTVVAPETIQINWLLTFYLFAVSLLVLWLAISIVKVTMIIGNAEKQRLRKIILAVTKEFIQPFSFLKYIVISEKDYTENRDIVVAHEQAHIQHYHSVDLIICELFTLLHWFNPFMWLLRHDLKLIHEYQTDQTVLNRGIDAKKYQLLVLEKSVGKRRFAMANYFTQKPILKRLKMMQKKNKKQWNAVKLILFIPIVLLLLQAFAQPEIISKGVNEFVPVVTQQDKTEKWLERWTIDNIGKGFFQTAMKSADSPITSNNVLVILMNRKNRFLIENQPANKEDVKGIVKDFLQGKITDGKKGPDLVEKDIPLVGKMKVSKGVISFRHDLVSSDVAINFTLRSIGEACLEVRKEKAQVLFGKDYFALSDEKQQAVDMAVPVWFSKEEPKIVKPQPPVPPTNPITMTVERPLIKVGEKWLTVNNKKVEISELSKVIKKCIENTGSLSTVELQIRDNVSKERIEKVNNELNKIIGLKVIRKDFTPPPPPKFSLKLFQDKITLWNKEIAMSEVSEKAKHYVSRYGKDRVISVEIENNINAERIHLLKKELRKAGALNINLSTMK